MVSVGAVVTLAALFVVVLLLYLLLAAVRSAEHARTLASALTAVHEELRRLHTRLDLALPASRVQPPTRIFSGVLNVEPEAAPLPEEELLALGRSIALQLYRGERTPRTLSRTEQQAVRLFRSVQGDDVPTGVPLLRRT
jgi:hypothetical protein